jgi:plastocyanin
MADDGACAMSGRRVNTAALAAVIAALCACVSAAPATTLEGVATIDGRPAAQAVVYLEGPEGMPPPAAAPGRVVMDQKNLAFRPGVLPVVRGTVVEFTNSDDVQHNVFSPSAIAGKFNLGTYAPGGTRMVTLDQPGDVRVLCNIHMEMEAHILVLDNPYFSTVGEDGRYRILDVPAGAYTVKIWDAQWLSVRQPVEIPGSGTLTVNVTAEK